MTALDGGEDGLRLVERLLREAPTRLQPGGLLALEIGHNQSDRVTAMMLEQGFLEASSHADHQGRMRFTTGLLA